VSGCLQVVVALTGRVAQVVGQEACSEFQVIGGLGARQQGTEVGLDREQVVDRRNGRDSLTVGIHGAVRRFPSSRDREIRQCIHLDTPVTCEVSRLRCLPQLVDSVIELGGTGVRVHRDCRTEAGQRGIESGVDPQSLLESPLRAIEQRLVYRSPSPDGRARRGVGRT